MDHSESPANFDARSTHHHDYRKLGASDDLFHFSPLAELYEETISPVCRPFRTDLNLSPDKFQHPSSPAGVGTQSESSDAKSQQTTNSSIRHCIVPPPCNSMEAYLLLEVARSDRQISLKRKDLAYEIVHRNTVALQLNRIFLERAERDLRAVDEHVGHVRLTIRQSGHSAASMYAMRESWLGGSEDNPPASSTGFDVVLD
ncbi:hypothetical protein EDD15DRAFT_2361262 [Pisolithus albus]|nr:hypothetical protein EDD15DRAFT_2361262 [Pisolithus albus]